MRPPVFRATFEPADLFVDGFAGGGGAYTRGPKGSGAAKRVCPQCGGVKGYYASVCGKCSEALVAANVRREGAVAA